MAESSVSLSQDQFSCSICLELLKDPATIPCGHSYCMRCITGYWDQDDQNELCSCPQCRQNFNPRPVLGKNTMLAEVVEKLKMKKLQAARPAQCNGESEDVECDVCTGRKRKAVNSCLVCLNSYCQNHLEQHENLFKRKRHSLMNATRGLQEMICPQHDKLLEVYCHTDQQCICYLCMMDEHKNHETVSAATEMAEKKTQLAETQITNQQRIQQVEEELLEMKEAVKFYMRSAQEAVKESERIFTALIRSIERSRSEVTQLIRDQEKAAVGRAEELLEQLEQEIADLRRRDAELEELSHTEDHVHFLQGFQSLSNPPEPTDLYSIAVNSLLTFEYVGKAVSNLKENVEHLCREKIKKLSVRVSQIEVIPTPDYKTREEFLQYFCRFTVDSNTVNDNLCLSEENRVVTYTDTFQSYPDHPDRFDFYCQVLCRESVCGRCYWEVEWSESDGMEISVSYKSINRKGDGDECGFGYNNQSWSLSWHGSCYLFWHNRMETIISVDSTSCRIGVYVDFSAGTLSFYSVSDTMTLIHRVYTTFTQPLCPGFGIVEDSTVKMCDLTI
ncbi:tripartite motif-containing protein 16-like isoform X2 [Xyrauchen texanus]|uniref:tripartite motif-containing protein 16-like isoform X2 n=1 Tax=Xyrauchen texanus TaxID=154827 RepID=UPI002241A4B3|nr:tripartite motif-containing protein 16-like isoform X2 [Xyrauchen texanus]